MTTAPAVPTRPASPGSRGGSGQALRQASRRRRLLWLVLLCAALAAMMLVSVAVGSRTVGWDDIVAALGGSAEGFDQAAVAKRIPRTLLAAAAGAALALSGAVMQGVTRNPLADPGILGVNTGASLAVVTGIAFFGLTSATSYLVVAILGGAVTAVLVYAIGSLGRGGATPLKLALAGAATSAALISFTSAIILGRANLADSIISWQIGGVGGGTFAALQSMLPFLVIGALVCWACARALNTLALGDEIAAGLGERVGTARAVSAFGAVALASVATAVCGPIGFVGLVVPHACRLISGVDHRWLLPYSAVVGALLLITADVLGRIIARPEEIDVGIITALIGAPVFIAIVRRATVREL